MLEALILRGEERDQEIVAKLASSPQFWGQSNKGRLKTLEKNVDISRLFQAHTWETVPSRYLTGYLPLERVARLGEAFLARYSSGTIASGSKG